jgi:hypothetical protein
VVVWLLVLHRGIGIPQKENFAENGPTFLSTAGHLAAIEVVASNQFITKSAGALEGDLMWMPILRYL